MLHVAKTIGGLILDAFAFIGLLLRRHRSLAGENLFLRKQLALYKERGMKPTQLDPATRVSMVLLAKLFN